MQCAENMWSLINTLYCLLNQQTNIFIIYIILYLSRNVNSLLISMASQYHQHFTRVCMSQNLVPSKKKLENIRFWLQTLNGIWGNPIFWGHKKTHGNFSHFCGVHFLQIFPQLRSNWMIRYLSNLSPRLLSWNMLGARCVCVYMDHRIHGTNGIFPYIYHKKPTECRLIYHTWILWVRVPASCFFTNPD